MGYTGHSFITRKAALGDQLQQLMTMIDGHDAELDRRGFLKIGGSTAAILSMAGGTGVAQQLEDGGGFSNAAFLIGPAENRPDAKEWQKDKRAGYWIYWGTSEGGVVLSELNYGDADWTLLSIGSSSNPVPSVTTESLDTTGQTWIEAVRGSAETGVSSGTWTNIVDGEDADNENEFNSSQQFVPSETAKYIILGSIEFESISASDRLGWRLRDTDGGSNVFFPGFFDSNEAIPIQWAGELTAGTPHEIQGNNPDSTFDIGNRTRYTITRSVVNP